MLPRGVSFLICSERTTSFSVKDSYSLYVICELRDTSHARKHQINIYDQHK